METISAVDIDAGIAGAVTKIEGPGNILFVCEHAGFTIPDGWGRLGLDECYFETHFAGDIGAAGLTRELAESLGCPAVLANYSRMFLDYNRFEEHWEYCRPDLGGIPVPGNRGLSPQDRALRARVAERPLHDAIEAKAGTASALVAIHSFTPVFHGEERMVDVGLVWKAGSEFGSLASDVLHHVGNARGIGVADNIPYAWTDTGARTMNLHGTAKGRNAVCIEVRNTLLTDVDDQPRILSFLTEAFKEVAGRL